MKRKHILVIGGAGYLGSVLVRKLIGRNYFVRVLDNLIYNNGASISDLIGNKNFSFFKGDFCSISTVNKVIEDITDVILLAALVGDPICKKYPEQAIEINQKGAINLIRFLNKKNIEKLIFTSTCSNYGINESEAKEEDSLNPLSLYARTKTEVEKYILNNKDKMNFCPVILRLATIYGFSNRMRFDLTVSDFTLQLTLGKKLIVYDENTWRPYCHIDDVCDVIIKIIEAKENLVWGEVFNVGDNNSNYTKKMIVDTILKYLGKGKVEYRKGDNDKRNYRVSFSKMNSKLNIKCKFTIDEYIPKLIHAIKNGLFDDLEKRKEFYMNYSIK